MVSSANRNEPEIKRESTRDVWKIDRKFKPENAGGKIAGIQDIDYNDLHSNVHIREDGSIVADAHVGSFRVRGTYDNTATYIAGDVVGYNGVAYLAPVNIPTGTAPPASPWVTVGGGDDDAVDQTARDAADAAKTAADAAQSDVDELTDTAIGEKAFKNPPSDLTDTEKTEARTAIGAGTGEGTGELADRSVTEPKLADNAVSQRTVGDDAIGGRELRAASVAEGHLSDGAVTGPKIPRDTIRSPHIAANQVGESEIAGEAVGDVELKQEVRTKIDGKLNVSDLEAAMEQQFANNFELDDLPGFTGLNPARTDDGKFLTLSVDRDLNLSVGKADAPSGSGSGLTLAQIVDRLNTAVDNEDADGKQFSGVISEITKVKKGNLLSDLPPTKQRTEIANRNVNNAGLRRQLIGLGGIQAQYERFNAWEISVSFNFTSGTSPQAHPSATVTKAQLEALTGRSSISRAGRVPVNDNNSIEVVASGWRGADGTASPAAPGIRFSISPPSSAGAGDELLMWSTSAVTDRVDNITVVGIEDVPGKEVEDALLGESEIDRRIAAHTAGSAQFSIDPASVPTVADLVRNYTLHINGLQDIPDTAKKLVVSAGRGVSGNFILAWDNAWVRTRTEIPLTRLVKATLDTAIEAGNIKPDDHSLPVQIGFYGSAFPDYGNQQESLSLAFFHTSIRIGDAPEPSGGLTEEEVEDYLFEPSDFVAITDPGVLNFDIGTTTSANLVTETDAYSTSFQLGAANRASGVVTADYVLDGTITGEEPVDADLVLEQASDGADILTHNLVLPDSSGTIAIPAKDIGSKTVRFAIRSATKGRFQGTLTLSNLMWSSTESRAAPFVRKIMSPALSEQHDEVERVDRNLQDAILRGDRALAPPTSSTTLRSPSWKTAGSNFQDQVDEQVFTIPASGYVQLVWFGEIGKQKFMHVSDWKIPHTDYLYSDAAGQIGYVSDGTTIRLRNRNAAGNGAYPGASLLNLGRGYIFRTWAESPPGKGNVTILTEAQIQDIKVKRAELADRATRADQANVAASATSAATATVANTVDNVRSGGTDLKLWSGTKAQYDAITTKDQNTLYIYPSE